MPTKTTWKLIITWLSFAKETAVSSSAIPSIRRLWRRVRLYRSLSLSSLVYLISQLSSIWYRSVLVALTKRNWWKKRFRKCNTGINLQPNKQVSSLSVCSKSLLNQGITGYLKQNTVLLVTHQLNYISYAADGEQFLFESGNEILRRLEDPMMSLPDLLALIWATRIRSDLGSLPYRSNRSPSTMNNRTN